jgi:peptidoglycan/LPS O-acetylase OafA/YrhL
MMRMMIHPSGLSMGELSFCEAVCGKYVVDIFFVISAVVVSLGIKRKFTEDKITL